MQDYKRIISTSLAFLLCLPLALAQYSVRGVVTDSVGTGEPYATVRIYTANDSTKAVKVGVTGEDGSFKQVLSKAGNYRLSITSVGKNEILRNFAVSNQSPDADLGHLIARLADNMLGEVEVVAQKPLVTAEIDRLSYDVASDEDAKTNTILEMLKKVPLVSVDGQDNIRVNGNSNFKIYKNGRPDNSFSGNPSQVLKSIPADLVEKIEVITEPGAKYDAEGVSGILNIVMKDNSRIDGVMGSLYGQYSTHNRSAASMYLTTSFNDKFTASANYSYSRITRESNKATYEQQYTYHDTGNINSGLQTVETPGNFHYGSLNMSYDIDTLNLITASASGYFIGINPRGNDLTQLFGPEGDLIYSMRQIYGDGYQYQYYNVDAQLNYQHNTHRKGESLNFSYQLASQHNTNDYISDYEETVNPPVDYTHYAYCSDQNLMEHTFQLDWTRPFGEKHKLDVGAKYIFRRNHSETTTQYDEREAIPSDFMHRTHVGAIYSEYAFSSGAWMARAGVRYEFSRMTGEYRNTDRPKIEKDLNDVVPTLSIGYRLGDKNNFRLNFSTRINRPGMGYLDPATNESPSLVSFGNPNLSSARNNSLQFTYSFIHPKITINTSVGYSFSNDQITSYSYLLDNVRYDTYDNIGKTRRAAFNASIQWMPTKKTNLSINGSANHEICKSDNLGIDNRRWSFGCYARMSQELPWKLRFGANFGRYDWGIDGLYSHYKPSYSYGFSLSRSFLKDDRLSVNIYALNPFSSKYRQSESRTTYGDYTGYSINNYRGRFVSLSVSFSFGSLKASVKKTRTSISNDDVVGGGQQGGSQGASN